MSLSVVASHYVDAAGPFKPTNLSGLVAWYSAEAETGLTDNTTMTTWHDQSGASNHATGVSTPKWRSAGGPTSGPAVQFTNAGYFTLPNIMGSATAGEIFVNLIQTPAANTGLWGFGVDSGASDESHYPFSGVVYDAFGCATGKRVSFSFAGTGAWHVFHVWAANNDHVANIDGVAKVTSTTTGAVGWTTNPTLGAGKRNIGVDLKYQGYMTTVIAFNRKLTSTERSDVLTYMAANPSGGTP